MELLTSEQMGRIPRLEMSPDSLDPMVSVLLHIPALNWAWYVIECDGKDAVYALDDRERAKWGILSLEELQQLRGPFGMHVQRAQQFRPMRLSEARHEVLCRHFR